MAMLRSSAASAIPAYQRSAANTDSNIDAEPAKFESKKSISYATKLERPPAISAPRSNQSAKKRYESLGTTSLVPAKTVDSVMLYT